MQYSLDRTAPPVEAVPGILGEVVERTFDNNGSPTSVEASFPSSSKALSESVAAPQSAATLRPIMAIAGRGFPAFTGSKSYGLRSSANRSTDMTRGNGDAAATATGGTPSQRVTFSAHVQPQEATGGYARGNGGAAGAGSSSLLLANSADPSASLAQQLQGNIAAFPVGDSAGSRIAMAHQWTPADFRALYEGYYTVPLDPAVVNAHAPALSSTTAEADKSAATPQPTGEDFFNALFQCLRSTVRTHQSIALDALRFHLMTSHQGGGRALRERCVRGPDCAPFLFFILDILSSAGHPFLCQQAGLCLGLLLLPSSDEAHGGSLAALVSEIGSPPPDMPANDDEEGSGGAEGNTEKDAAMAGESNKRTREDDPDLPFHELSEMLRTGGEMAKGLERMGFTNHIMAALSAFLPGPDAGEPFPGASTPDGDASDKTNGGEHEAKSAARQQALLLLWLALLGCGGMGVSAVVSCRVARDPAFLGRVVEPLLRAAVLVCGADSAAATRTLPASAAAPVAGVLSKRVRARLLLTLYRLAHIPAALKHLLYGPAEDSEGSGINCGGVRLTGASMYETWVLYFITVCTTKPCEVCTMHDVACVLLSQLLLRETARQGYEGLLHDICDTLVSDGLAVGSGIVLEMWALLSVSPSPSLGSSAGSAGIARHTRAGLTRGHSRTASTSGKATGNGLYSVEQLLQDAGRSALASISSSPSTYMGTTIFPRDGQQPRGPSSDTTNTESTAAAQTALATLVALANRHYLATYLRTRRMSSLTLLGSAVETQAGMQHVLATRVLRSDWLSTAFSCLTTPSRGGTGVVDDLLLPDAIDATLMDALHFSEEPQGNADVAVPTATETKFSVAAAAAASNSTNDSARMFTTAARDRQWLQRLDAALLLANVRVAGAILATYPAVDRAAVTGYAAALAARFEHGCLSMRGDALSRFQTDELCTMIEALDILRGESRKEETSSAMRAITGTASPQGKASTASSSPRHDAQRAAVFLAHAIAITKQCLDAAPQVVACMLDVETRTLEETRDLVESGKEDTATSKYVVGNELVGLALSLLTGVEVTPPLQIEEGQGMVISSSTPAGGAPRSWVLHPLFDDCFPYKARWAQWLRQVLGLHQSMKAILGWDAILCHTLLWTVAHRKTLFAADTKRRTQTGIEGEQNASSEVGEDFSFDGIIARQSGRALTDLLCTLSELLLGSDDTCDRVTLSASASQVLGAALSDYTNPQAEECLPPSLFLVLMLLATRCYDGLNSSDGNRNVGNPGSSTAALAVCQVLLHTPVDATELDAISANDGKAGKESWLASTAAHRIAYEVVSWRTSMQMSTGRQLPSPRAPAWGLDSVVALLQLMGPCLAASDSHLATSDDTDEPVNEDDLSTLSAEAFHRWCIHTLTFYILYSFIVQQWERNGKLTATGGSEGNALSTMQRAVLRSTLEDLDWEPQPLWSLVQN